MSTSSGSACWAAAVVLAGPPLGAVVVEGAVAGAGAGAGSGGGHKMVSCVSVGWDPGDKVGLRLTSRNAPAQAGDLVQPVLGAGLDLCLATGLAQTGLLGGARRGGVLVWRQLGHGLCLSRVRRLCGCS